MEALNFSDSLQKTKNEEPFGLRPLKESPKMENLGNLRRTVEYVQSILLTAFQILRGDLILFLTEFQSIDIFPDASYFSLLELPIISTNRNAAK